jgi:hypothetical protein
VKTQSHQRECEGKGTGCSCCKVFKEDCVLLGIAPLPPLSLCVHERAYAGARTHVCVCIMRAHTGMYMCARVSRSPCTFRVFRRSCRSREACRLTLQCMSGWVFLSNAVPLSKVKVSNPKVPPPMPNPTDVMGPQKPSQCSPCKTCWPFPLAQGIVLPTIQSCDVS